MVTVGRFHSKVGQHVKRRVVVWKGGLHFISSDDGGADRAEEVREAVLLRGVVPAAAHLGAEAQLAKGQPALATERMVALQELGLLGWGTTQHAADEVLG